MKIKIDQEFKTICQEILNLNLSPEEWNEIESDDYFQTDHFIGGFDSTEQAFCFSYYINDKEYWLQVDLEQIRNIDEGKLHNISIFSAL